MTHKILIMGLPGSGKTSLARKLAPLLPAVWFDADYVRAILWPELGFGREDRIENARRMGALCNEVNCAGFNAVASFVCPLPEMRTWFNATYTIWIDRIQASRFADTNEMFVPPPNANLRLVSGSVNDWLEVVRDALHNRRDVIHMRERELSRIAMEVVRLRL